MCGQSTLWFFLAPYRPYFIAAVPPVCCAAKDDAGDGRTDRPDDRGGRYDDRGRYERRPGRGSRDRYDRDRGGYRGRR